MGGGDPDRGRDRTVRSAVLFRTGRPAGIAGRPGRTPEPEPRRRGRAGHGLRRHGGRAGHVPALPRPADRRAYRDWHGESRVLATVAGRAGGWPGTRTAP